VALTEWWEQVLTRDLEGFADPRTDVLVDATGATITAAWTQRGKDRQAEFRLSTDGDFRWMPSEAQAPQTYRQFLCSEGLADFDQLASAIVRAFPAANHYIPTQAALDSNGAAAEPKPAHELMLERSSDALGDPAGKTQMLFLKGDAGSGKTTLLREVSRTQAELFRQGKSPFIYLYVSAQGRALSNLRDALSGELDDLRAGFTRDAVPPLVRQGLVVPIIDGFDELLGAAGYGDAFGSLHQFLDQLDGLGVLIVSARSSFYDVEFLGRELTEGTQASAYDIVPVTLRPWSNEEIFHYLARVRGGESVSEEDRKAVLGLPLSDRGLLAKPFFASLFPEYVDSPEGKDRGVSLSEYLVDSYVRRESEKIVDRDGRALLEVDGHRRIFELTAEFMWTGEKRDFNADDLRTVAELVADEVDLAGDSAKQLVTKITSYAGFRTSRQGREQRFQFEHEVYFDHFLSEALRRRLPSAGELGSFLDGGLLAEEMIVAVVDADNALQWLALLDGFQRNTALQENRRRNAGTLAAVCFRMLRKIEARSIRFCHFVNTTFGDATFDAVEFRDCRFVAVRLERARFQDCRLENCVAESLVVAGQGRMGISGLVPGENLYCLIDVESSDEVYSPADMKRLLDRAGVPGMAEEPPVVRYSERARLHVDLLQRIVSKYRQSNLLCLEDDRLIRLFQDPSWPSLRDLLVDHQIVVEESRQTSGSKKTFFRTKVSLADLMRLEGEATLPAGPLGNFWGALRAM